MPVIKKPEQPAPKSVLMIAPDHLDFDDPENCLVAGTDRYTYKLRPGKDGTLMVPIQAVKAAEAIGWKK